MTIKILMFSSTALAGAPIRIANALNAHTECEVRLVDLKRWAVFQHDHVHEENPEKTLELAEKADIIHLFNYLDRRSRDFFPVDFTALEKKGKRLIRMFESTPFLISKRMGIPLDEVLYDDMPQLVIAQYPERFYPRAMVVPNIIPQDSTEYLPDFDTNPKWSAVFAPTWPVSAWETRWDTKGMPETLLILNKVTKSTGMPYCVMHQRPFADIMPAKRQSALVIDDLVTGSYHLSGLEGLSLGKPSLGYLDDRTQYVLRAISGCQECPFISTRLEDAGDIIKHLLRNPDLAVQIGKESREWIEQYWADHRLVEHYTEVYRLLLEDPGKIERQQEYRLDSVLRKFYAIDLPDRIYEARRRLGINTSPLSRRLKKKYKKIFRKMKSVVLRK